MEYSKYNINNNIVIKLEEENENEPFNKKINCEINKVLNETDSVLSNAESELNTIKNYDELEILTNEVTCDLFKDFGDEHNISAILPLDSQLFEEKENIPKEFYGEQVITVDVDVEKDNLKITDNLKEFDSKLKQTTTDVVHINIEKENSKITEKENIPKEDYSNSGSDDVDIQKEKPKETTDINSNNCPKVQKISLKRPANTEEPIILEAAKKMKLSETDEILTLIDDTQTHYTQVIFDPDETADANDPKWPQFNDNLTIEEHFESVRKQWRSMALPNPHKNLTMRFVPEHLKYKPSSAETSDNKSPETSKNTNDEHIRCMSCATYLENKINKYTQKVNALYVKLKYLPQSKRGRSQRNKLLREIEDMQKFVIEIVKNREEIQQNFMFYAHPNNTWNANYLSRNELDDLKEQEKVFEFQKKFYSK